MSCTFYGRENCFAEKLPYSRRVVILCQSFFHHILLKIQIVLDNCYILQGGISKILLFFAQKSMFKFWGFFPTYIYSHNNIGYLRKLHYPIPKHVPIFCSMHLIEYSNVMV